MCNSTILLPATCTTSAAMVEELETGALDELLYFLTQLDIKCEL